MLLFKIKAKLIHQMILFEANAYLQERSIHTATHTHQHINSDNAQTRKHTRIHYYILIDSKKSLVSSNLGVKYEPLEPPSVSYTSSPGSVPISG